jgi:putative component of membrane protein insertase Oxa1/YidC/SpoIIIJ protein YidD
MNKHISTFFIAFILFLQIKSQSFSFDKTILAASKTTNSYYEEKKITFFENKNKSVISKYNPVSLFFKSSMYAYQSFFSKQLFSQCIYSPSCSEMSKKLIAEFGLFKGIFLSADRITRCSPQAFFDRHQSCVNIHDGKIHESISLYKKQK